MNCRAIVRHPLPLLVSALLLALTLPAPAAACTHPVGQVTITITVDGTNVWIIITGFQTSLASAGTNCACGIQLVPSLASVGQPQIFSNGQPLAGFSNSHGGTNFCASDPRTVTSFNSQQPGLWSVSSVALSAGVSAGTPVEIRYHGKLAAGKSQSTLVTELKNLQKPVGAGELGTDAALVTPASAFPSSFTVATKSATAAETLTADLVAVHEESPGSVELVLQDAQEGLSVVWVEDFSNAVTRIGTFAPATREPVAARLTMRNPAYPSTAEINACNLVGACRTIRTTLMTVQPGADLHSIRTMPVEASMSHAFFQNSDNGIRMLSLALNERRFSIRPLAAGQSVEADLSLATVEGENQLVCTARGEANTHGLLVLTDAQ